MDISTTTAALTQSALGVMGEQTSFARQAQDFKTNILVEVVEGVQAAYDLGEEVSQSRQEARNTQPQPAEARQDDDDVARKDEERPEDNPTTGGLAPVETPPGGKGQALDVIA